MSAQAPERLADIGWLTAEPLKSVLDALNQDGIETRVVGGAVRNALMGLPPGDVDLASTATPEIVSGRVRAAGMKAVPTGIAHGTVTIIAGGSSFEVTTLRHDVETHGRHATVAFGASWTADARRRDFTMNALYADATGRLHDPVSGYPDILARRVRFIGDAQARIREDYLRILRFFRFHAEYGRGQPDAGGVAATIRERQGLLRLSGERVRQEFLRLLLAPGAAAVLEVMADSGILGLVLAGVAYRDAFARMAAIEAEAGRKPDPMLRVASLAVVIAEDGERLAERLRLSNAERDRLRLAGEDWRSLAPSLSNPARRKLLYRLGPSRFIDAALLGWARSLAGADDAGWRDLADLPKRWTAPRFPLKGADLVALGLPKGPELGRLLRQIEQEWIEEDFAADRKALLHRARTFAARPSSQ